MDVLPWSHLVYEQSWTGELWKVFSRSEILEIHSEAGYCGSGWVDWDFLDWGWVLLVTTLNSLRVRTSYTEKQIWCALLGKPALPCILEAAGTSSGIAVGKAATCSGLPLYRATLATLSKTRNLRYMYTYTHAHSGDHDSRDTALMNFSIFEHILKLPHPFNHSIV